MRRLVPAAPVLIGPAALAFAKGGYFDVPRLVAGVAAWALVLVVALVAPEPLPRDPAARATLAGLAALTAWVGASIAWAPIPGAASDDLQRLLLYLGAFVAALALLRPPVVRGAVEPVLLAGIVAAVLYGLSERLLPGVVRLSALPAAGDRLAWPLTYWNALGALAGIGLVLAAGVAAGRGRALAWRAAAAACAPVLGLGCYLTFSRGALGATVAGFAILLALAPTARQLRAAAVVVVAAALAALATVALPAVEAAGGSAGQGAAMIAVLAALAAVAAALAGRGEPRDRPASARRGALTAPDEARGGAQAGDGPLPRVRAGAVGAVVVVVAVTAVAVSRAERHGGTATRAATPSRLVSAQSNRYAYWRVAVRTFAAHPLVGVGSGGFRVEWLRERPFAESVRDAHSLYLETAAELGVVGLAALALAIGGGAAVCARAVRREGAPAAPAVAAVALWALHAGIDWDWEMPALSLVALVLLARLAPGAPAA